jgi:ABC-type proline/glycine betaine transport system substrate-binding protein
VPFSSVVFNEGNAAWDGTVYTIPVSGYYEVTGQFKSNNSGAYAAGLGLQKSTDGGTTWTQIAYSPNNAANSFGGSYLEDTEYFTAGVKLRLNLNGAGLTPVSDAPAENTFFTVRLVSYTGIAASDAVKQSPNLVNFAGTVSTTNPLCNRQRYRSRKFQG